MKTITNILRHTFATLGCFLIMAAIMYAVLSWVVGGLRPLNDLSIGFCFVFGMVGVLMYWTRPNAKKDIYP